MNSEKAIWRAITEVVTVEQLNEITSRVLHQRERPAPSGPAAPEPTWWEKEEAKTNQEFRDYAHRFGAKPGDNIFDFVMRDAMTYRDQQPVMKCRSCGASTQEYKPVLRSHGLICSYCGAMLVDRVEPAAPMPDIAPIGDPSIGCCGNLQHPPGGEAMSQLTPQQEQEYVERVWEIEYTVGGEFSSCVVWGRVPRSSPRPNADDWHAAFLYTIERERQITVVEKQIAWLDGLPESWKDDIFGQIHQHAQAVLDDLKRGFKEQP